VEWRGTGSWGRTGMAMSTVSTMSNGSTIRTSNTMSTIRTMSNSTLITTIRTAMILLYHYQ
jgi:hypothetical protein